LLVPFDDRSPVSGPKDLGTRKNCPSFRREIADLKRKL
jgi:hypothetical protein